MTLPETHWTGVLQSPGGPLSFGIEFDQVDQPKKCSIVNGEERIAIDQFQFDGQTLVIGFPHYNSMISASYDANQAEFNGQWRKVIGNNKSDELTFKATAGSPKFQNDGFESLAGRYEVSFESSKDPAIGQFSCNEDRVDGTFLTTTGDYRFLAGSFDAELQALTLSCFDGGHAFLFHADIQSDKTLKGDFWSRGSWHETWTAKKNETIQLADGFDQVKWQDANLNELKFPDLDGKLWALDDPKFQGPVRIIQVFGSWCPNCHDASVVINQLHQQYSDQGLSVLGLAFELSGEFQKDAEQIRKYQQRTGATYPILIVGLADKKKAAASLKILSQVKSYPTTVFLDANNNPIAIHSGFTGPATGKPYIQLKEKFHRLVQSGLKNSK